MRDKIILDVKNHYPVLLKELMVFKKINERQNNIGCKKSLSSIVKRIN
jgi:hypothetical protein